MNNPLVLSVLILISVSLNSLGQNLLKLGAGQNPLNVYLFGGITAYAVSTVFYVLVLGKLNLSLVYPLVIGLTITSTTLSGSIFLKEQVSYLHWVGIGLILSGIVAIAFGRIS